MLGAGVLCFLSFFYQFATTFLSAGALGKTYSFAIFGLAMARANCKCVWLLRWL